MLKLWLDENFPVGLFQDDILWFDNGMVLTCESVKWYDSYADVQWHQQLLKEVQLYSCATFRYVRLGEDPSDIEIDEYGGKDCGAYVEIDVETKFAHNFPEEIDYNKEVRNGTV